MLLGIPVRLTKLVLSGCCGLGATALFVAGKLKQNETWVYGSYGAAAASVLLFGQAVLPADKKDD